MVMYVSCVIILKSKCNLILESLKDLNELLVKGLVYYLKQMSYLNREGKQEFKTKVGHLMQEYQRSKQEEQQKKQQLKQNIMMQILTKRNKESQPITQEDYPPTKVTNFNQQENQQEDVPSITFKPTNLRQILINPHNDYKEENRTTQPIPLQQHFASNKTEKEQSQQLKGRTSKEENLQKKDYVFTSKQKQETTKRNEDQDSGGSFEVENMQQEEKKQYPSYLSKYLAQKQEPKGSQYKPEKEQQRQIDSQKKIEQNITETEGPGVFLTMEESQSMTASQLPKNVTFEIKMDSNQNPDHLEELRKLKIKEIERKRQERIQEFRKNEAAKKVEMPRGRSSNIHKNERTERDEPLSPQIPPESVKIQRKSNLQRPPKMQNRSERELPPRNQLVPLEYYEGQYKMKDSTTKVNQKYDNKEPFIQVEDYKPVSPIRTPKTIMSQHRPKSTQKNSNIFAAQSQYREKSATRVNEPKIEPKDRKYSFTRQSNKKLMINAITYVCFPGELNRKDRERLIDVLEESQHQFFVFLFKEYSRKIIKGIYVLDNSQTRLEKIYGDKAPLEITADRVQEFYRFDSGSREFKKVAGCKSFSFVIHAIDLV